MKRSSGLRKQYIQLDDQLKKQTMRLAFCETQVPRKFLCLRCMYNWHVRSIRVFVYCIGHIDV